MSFEIEPARAAAIAQGLLCWYDENKRDLPWRHTGDPYAIWVSETMAQQTRIAFLTAYYERFMARFPTVQSLAEADTTAVLKAWEGLGYYSRARNMQNAARQVMAMFGGRVPRTKKELLTLPGIGEYTAGAILSIAYGIPAPAVDGNVLRVFSRLENSDADINLPPARRQAADFVAAVMPNHRAGCFTQALMELGALVCLPKTPDCGNCPVAAVCRARQWGREGELPFKSAKKSPQLLEKTIFILRNRDGEILMRRRTERMLSGLWEFHMAEGALTEADARAWLRQAGWKVQSIGSLGEARHVFTHQIWQMRGYDCRVEGNWSADETMWVKESDIKELPIPAALRFYVQKI